jgi:hypothetical protein
MHVCGVGFTPFHALKSVLPDFIMFIKFQNSETNWHSVGFAELEKLQVGFSPTVSLTLRTEYYTRRTRSGYVRVCHLGRGSSLAGQPACLPALYTRNAPTFQRPRSNRAPTKQNRALDID